MSKFFQALEQAERDRALRERARPGARPADDVPDETATPAPVTAPPATEALPAAGERATPLPARTSTPERQARPAVLKAPPVPTREATPAAAAPPPPVRPPSSPRVDGPAPGTGAAPAAAPAETPAPGRVDGRLVSLLSPGAIEAEQYRGLRHLVEQFHKTASLTVLAVTSPGAGDGKTTTAINLAGALAQDPAARVLLVDADLRAPALPQRLGLGSTAERGLVDAILDARLRLEDVVRRAAPFNVSLLAAGRRPGVPYELLASPRFGELLDGARRAFDYVVLDSPPLVLFPDCRLMGQWVDGFLLVVAADRTPRKLVEEGLALIEPAKLMGLVFNGDRRALSSYYGDGYASRYRQDDPVAANGHGAGWLGSLWRGRARRPARPRRTTP
jgi:protein-tyrosine kinase